MLLKHLAITLGLFFLCALKALGAPTKATPLAIVGQKVITVEEFKKRWNDIVKQSALNPPAPDLFLEELIRYEVGTQEAEKVGIQNDPIVKERFRQEMYKALVEKALGDKVNAIQVTEAEMKQYYKYNPDIRTSHILIEYKPDATPQEKHMAKKRAMEIFKEVTSSQRDFAEQARLLSDDIMTKDHGGDLNYQNRVTMVVPFYYDAAIKAKVGDIIGPIETRLGFHIIKVTGRRSYDQVTNKRLIRTAVFDEKRKDLFNAYFKNLKSKYKIEINRTALKGLKEG